VREAIRDIPQVLECHHVTGEYDYLLKVVARGRKDLERFVLEQLTPIKGIAGC
jgi:Lrp/AsnC family leucine-responsive transcriptional regulator